MVKDDKDVIAEFNEYVNMTASELEKWLKSEESSEAGWRKDGGDGKSVGQDSGEKIIEILKANPDKDPEKYTEDQIQHMRKVASYCKRHLAQESSSLEEKSPEEAKKTKSYISLKNWGHDPLKGKNGDKSSSGKNGSKSSSKTKEQEGEDDEQEEQDDNGEEAEENNEEEEGEDDKKAGDKRKKSGQQNGSNKKRETRQGASSKKNGDNGADEEDEDADDDAEDGDQEEKNGGGESGGKKPSKNGPKKGETVSWNWGSGNPEGKVLDVKEDE